MALVESFTALLDQSQTFIKSSEKQMEVLCTEGTVPTIINLITDNENASALQLTLTKLEKVPIVGHGMGRKCKIVQPMTIEEAINRIKSHLGLPYVRLALAHGAKLDNLVKSVAACAGSGSSVLRGNSADLWLTGEMSHHEVLDAIHQGTTVILTDHSNSERNFLKTLQPRLYSALDQKVQVLISEKDRDPLEVV
ncbi:NIF3-like protein 1 [Homarus americanus]|uniref:NIF3-like protein 1 n=1 Tax=Homarus americanus TaxID=6706 RepID=UPI001C48AA47|nr:NIF3-like protein 1 [Homarus americanus]